MIVIILFATFMFCAIWFIIFKTKIIYDKNKQLENIAEKMEKQNNKFFVDGKELDLKQKLELPENYYSQRKSLVKEKKSGFIHTLKILLFGKLLVNGK